MRVVVNGQEIHLPATPGGLLISLHLEPGGEDFGPCVIDVYGGELRFTGNDANPHAVTVTSRHSGYGIVACAAQAPQLSCRTFIHPQSLQDAYDTLVKADGPPPFNWLEVVDPPPDPQPPRGGFF